MAALVNDMSNPIDWDWSAESFDHDSEDGTSTPREGDPGCCHSFEDQLCERLEILLHSDSQDKAKTAFTEKARLTTVLNETPSIWSRATTASIDFKGNPENCSSPS
eukprot:TRINITY_DN120952_c0_g1_i1.p1 TRINITY_DN120952_c0_g1~~TRINITY_DN120952_c0_g1_i1.p1  ORF type:complete len:121 (-),score=12.85 TRINITY_DN120952_c0_g1_i1:89-406(-)